MNSATIPEKQQEVSDLHSEIFGGNIEDTDSEPDLSRLTEPDRIILEEAFRAKNGEKVRRLFTGDASDYESRSEADSGLCYHLVFWLGRDRGRVERVFRQSGLYRDKWDKRHYADGVTYGVGTIQKAIENVEETYLEKHGQGQGPEPGRSRKEFEELIEAAEDFDELTETLAPEVRQSRLSAAAKDWLLKRIADKAGVRVTTLRGQEECNGGFSHRQVAETVIDGIGKDNIICIPGELVWRWMNCGLWEITEARAIKQMIQRTMDEAGHIAEVTKNVVSSIEDIIKTEIFREGHQFDVYRDSINCLNGELHRTSDGWELKPHCREHYRTTQIPVEYDSEAKAPRFEQFLEEVFRYDEDKDEKIDLVHECIGYTLLASTEFEKFIILIGPGANGKSVLLTILRNLLGAENIAGVQPEQFNRAFQRAHLLGKLANIVTEIPRGHKLADAELKAIVSGELMTAEFKFKPAFDFSPFCTCWFATNYMPKSNDNSSALFRRAIVIPFERVFSENEQDRRLPEKLKEELPGILNLALESITQVFAKGGFTEPTSSVDAINQWRFDIDHIAQFVDDLCEINAAATVKSGDLYEAYLKWVERFEVMKPYSRNAFTKKLRSHDVEPHKGSNGSRELKGIKLADK